MSTPEHVAMIEATVARQRAFFQTGATRPVAVRVAALHKLKREMQARETILLDALYADLHKSHAEGYMCELGLNLDELGYLARKLPQWAKPQRHPTPLAQFCSSSYQLAEPYGVVLVMSPWNYPYLLSLDPLFGAIAAGNCVVLKPSAYAPNTSRAMAELIAAVFPPDWVTVIQGGREQNAALLEQKFDYIFFTGSVDVGKMVMEKASRHLTPVTLELGGKSPVIVDRTANLPLTARRLAFGKILNAGQTCVAPDYVLVHRSVQDALTAALKKQSDLVIIKEKDYIRNAKPNGYRSYHIVLGIPVYFLDAMEYFPVEVQLRTMAMDFWASMEHRVCYKKQPRNRERLEQDFCRYARILEEIEGEFETHNERRGEDGG